MNEQRLIEIETKLAHQEVLITELNHVIAQQQSAISQLQSALKSFLNGYLGSKDKEHVNERPPHY